MNKDEKDYLKWVLDNGGSVCKFSVYDDIGISVFRAKVIFDSLLDKGLIEYNINTQDVTLTSSGRDQLSELSLAHRIISSDLLLGFLSGCVFSVWTLFILQVKGLA